MSFLQPMLFDISLLCLLKNEPRNPISCMISNAPHNSHHYSPSSQFVLSNLCHHEKFQQLCQLCTAGSHASLSLSLSQSKQSISIYQMHSSSSAARISGILVWRKAVFWDPITKSLSITTGEVHTVAICETHGMPTWIMHCASPFVLSTKVVLTFRVLRATEPTNTVLAAQDVLLSVL